MINTIHDISTPAENCTGGGAFTNLVGCIFTAALMRGGWVENSVQTVFNWMNLANASEHVNANQVLMLYFSIS